MEIIFIGINYGFLSKTNQMVIINVSLLEKVFNISGNFIVHITYISRFLYSNIIHSLAILINIILTTIIIIRFFNVIEICSLFNWHYNRISKKHDVLPQCTFQTILYIIWIIINIVTMALKGIAINFAYRSHTLIKKLTKRSKRNKKKRKPKFE